MEQVICEHDITNIKKKMTEIRRNRQGRVIRQNYYGNCDRNEETFVVYGVDTIVLWGNDHGVIRGYFYSSDAEELAKLLQHLPQGCTIDYLTKTKGEMQNFLEASGFKLLHEMHRMSSAGLTEAEKKKIAENYALMREALYRPEHVRKANLEDLESVYNKLYEIFDVRESHLPTKKELAQFITNGWVSIYDENQQLLGIQIFTVNEGQFYGYQLWNGTGPEGYFSLMEMTNYLYGEYLRKHHIELGKVKPSYSWVNAKNRKNMRLVKFWGAKFDGLYDFVYEKQ